VNTWDVYDLQLEVRGEDEILQAECPALVGWQSEGGEVDGAKGARVERHMVAMAGLGGRGLGDAARRWGSYACRAVQQDRHAAAREEGGRSASHCGER